MPEVDDLHAMMADAGSDTVNEALQERAAA
jgi:hypothetical protein